MESPILLLKKSWEFYKTEWKVLTMIYSVPWVAVVLSALIPIGDEVVHAAWSLLFIPVIILGLLAGIALLAVVAHPQEATLKGSYVFACKYFFPYVWVSILTGLAVLGGFILLIIPGIIFSIWFSFSAYALLFEQKKGVSALRASRSYVRGRWWAVAWRLLFFGIISLIITTASVVLAEIIASSNEFVTLVISSLGDLIVVPLAVTYTYYLYRNLKETTPETLPPQTDQTAPQEATV